MNVVAVPSTPTKPLVAASPPYANIKEAYRHLLQLDSYSPFDHRPKGRWVVVFFEQTSVARIFPTLESVGDLYPWDIYRVNVFLTPEQLAAKVTTASIKRALKEYNTLYDESAKPIDLAKQLWIVLQSQCDAINEKLSRVKSSSLMDDKYHVRIDLIKSPDYVAKISEMPKQARVICEELAKAEKSSYSVEEMTSFMRELVFKRILKTKQDSFRIFRYYAPVYSDMGLVVYRGRKINDKAA